MYTRKTSLFFINAIVITVLSCIANIAFAQSATNTISSSTQEVSTSTPAVSETKSVTTTEFKEITTAKKVLSAQKRVRLTNLIANISNRIEAGLSRLEAIAKRIESRALTLETEGYDVTDTKLYVTEAKNTLAQTRTKMQTIDEHVVMMVGSDNPRELWTSIKELLVSGALELQNAKASLVKALQSLKSAKILSSIEPVVSTTTTTDNENVIELVN